MASSLSKVKEKIEEKKTLSDEELAKIRIEDIEALQKNGVFRYELLLELKTISNHLFHLNSIIFKIAEEKDEKD